MELTQEHRLTVVEDRSLRNEGRIKKLENENAALHDMAKSMAVMAEQQKNISTKVDTLDSKVDAIEAKPAKRWDAIVDKLIWAVLAALVAFMLGRVGL